MDVRSLRLTVHVLSSGGAYWALSVQRGAGPAYVLSRGVVSDPEFADWVQPLALLQAAAQAAQETRGQ
jgi:hypothetical protein